MIFLSSGNLINWTLAAYGASREPVDFAFHLLSIFIVNLLLYTSFYIIMKVRSLQTSVLSVLQSIINHFSPFNFCNVPVLSQQLRHREKILPQPLIYILLSMVCWAGALYFFFQKSTTWQLTPAQSRAFNKECLILNFYDDHDIWHFLSAVSMFFSFMVSSCAFLI